MAHLVFFEINRRTIAGIGAFEDIVSEVAVAHVQLGDQLNTRTDEKDDKYVHMQKISSVPTKTTINHAQRM